MKHTPKEDLIARWAAAACTLAILFFLGSVLLHTPMAVAPARDEALQVYFVPRAPDLPVPPPRMAATPAPAATPARAPAHSPAVAAAPTPLPTPRSERPTAAAREHEPMAAQLYTREGRVRLPPGAQVDALDSGLAAAPPGLSNPREIDRARRIMERPNPVNYRETRFAKDWKSDGTLGDVAVQGLNRGMKNVNRAIFGDDVQTAKARPPPDVRFNPGLAENAGDLGREATGDAYKAAPIAHEAPPDLKGEASRRIRSELAALEPLLARCDSTRRAALLTPARTHLGDLERAEHALGHGADPVMAEQMLPRQADSAYDLARRALWYARQQAATCKG